MADFLEINPKDLSDRALLDLIHQLSGNEAHRESLRACQKEQVLRAMKNFDLTQNEIVRELCRSTSLETRKIIAKEWAPVLGISERDFLKIAGFRKV